MFDDAAVRERALLVAGVLRYSSAQPRVPAGSDTGGQFGPSEPTNEPAPRRTFSYNPRTGKGAGYGVKGGDPQVKAFQELVNRLGITDAKGRKLAVDGKFGPLTTQAAEALQQKLGMAQTGRITQTLLDKVAGAKTLDEAKAALAAKSRKPRRDQIRDLVAREVQAILRSDVDNDPIGDLDDETLVLLTAMAELDADAGVEGRAWDPTLHARWPKGHPKAGKFRTMVDLLKMAIANHDGKGHPFELFNREQLRKAAKARGIELKRGEDKDSIAAKLLADLGGTVSQPSAIEKAAAPAKKAAPKKTAAKLKAGGKIGEVLSGDFSVLEKVGEGSGTTPAGIYKAPDGSRWYVKAQKSAEHANNEALASALYRAAGIDAPGVLRGKGAPGLPGEHHTATRLVDGAQANLKQKLGDDSYVADIRKGFAVDAWLANWDVAGEGSERPWANIVEGSDGRPHRIDVGGAILFRGKGGEKGDRFGPKVVEFDTMRTPNKGRRHALIFAEITDQQLSESVNRVRLVTPTKIHNLVAEHGFDIKLAELLVARRNDLLSRMKASAKVTPKNWEKAAINNQALEAAPAKITSWIKGTAQSDLEKLGLDPITAGRAIRGFADYQDGMYGTINQALLKAAGGDLRTVGHLGLDDTGIDAVEAMDKTMQVSRLTKDVIVYRGERAPARNFPPGTWSMTGGMEGMEWTFHAYGSSSVNGQVAADFARGPTTAPKEQRQPTVMRILAPKGTQAVNLEGSLESEQELLLARSLKYRVVKDHGVVDDPGYSQGVRRLDVEVVPA